MTFLCMLPKYLVIPLFSEWMTFADICMWDSAVCSSKYRHNYIRFITDDAFSFDKIVLKTHDKISMWCIIRGIKVTDLKSLNNLFFESYSEHVRRSLRKTALKERIISFFGYSNGAHITSLEKFLNILTGQGSATISVLRILDLSSCYFLTDQHVVGILQKCQKLNEVNLSYCTTLTGQTLAVLAESNRYQLRRLSLTGCQQFTENEISAVLLASCESLTYLNLSECYQITDTTLSVIANSCVGLKHLDLSCAHKDTTANPCRHFISLKKLTKLESLYLSNGCVSPLNNSLNIPALQSVSLSGLYDNDILFCLTNGLCVSLTALVLSGCELSDNTIEQLTLQCSHLTSLSLLNVGHYLSGDALRSIGRNCHDRLLGVAMTEYQNMQSTDIISFSYQCWNLQSIDLSGSLGVNDSAVEAVTENCKQLSSVTFNDCTLVSNYSIDCLAQHCGSRLTCVRINSIAIGQTPSVTLFSERCTSLVILEICLGFCPPAVFGRLLKHSIHLTSLSIKPYRTVIESLVSEIARNTTTKLCELSIKGDIRGDVLLPIMTRFPLLTSVDFDHAPTARDDVLTTLVDNCKLLTKISLRYRYGDNSDGPGLSYLVKRCLRLTSLSLHYCRFSTRTVHVIGKHANALRELNLHYPDKRIPVNIEDVLRQLHIARPFLAIRDKGAILFAK